MKMNHNLLNNKIYSKLIKLIAITGLDRIVFSNHILDQKNQEQDIEPFRKFDNYSSNQPIHSLFHPIEFPKNFYISTLYFPHTQPTRQHGQQLYHSSQLHLFDSTKETQLQFRQKQDEVEVSSLLRHSHLLIQLQNHQFSNYFLNHFTRFDKPEFSWNLSSSHKDKHIQFQFQSLSYMYKNLLRNHQDNQQQDYFLHSPQFIVGKKIQKSHINRLKTSNLDHRQEQKHNRIRIFPDIGQFHSSMSNQHQMNLLQFMTTEVGDGKLAFQPLCFGQHLNQYTQANSLKFLLGKYFYQLKWIQFPLKFIQELEEYPRNLIPYPHFSCYNRCQIKWVRFTKNEQCWQGLSSLHIQRHFEKMGISLGQTNLFHFLSAMRTDWFPARRFCFITGYALRSFSRFHSEVLHGIILYQHLNPKFFSLQWVHHSQVLTDLDPNLEQFALDT